MADQLNIAVVGCGVAGATAALLLARSGHRVTLFEQSAQVGPVGAGVLLQPSGQRVLKEIGLLDDVIAHAEPIAEIYATTHRHHDLVRLRYADLHDGCTGYGLHRGDLFTVLHRELLSAGVDLRLNQPVTAFTQDAHVIRPMDGDGQPLGEFDLLIAADGSRSRLRASAHVRQWTMPYKHGAVWVVGRNDAIRGQLRQVTRSTRELCGLLPMGGGRCSLFWGLHERDQPALFAGGVSAWREKVVRLLPEAAAMFERIENFADVKFVRYQHVWMSRWNVGRAVFIGDAAHAMSPHLGQGVNLALVDAQHLCKAIDAAADPARAAEQYDRQRRGQVRAYAAVTFGLAPFFQSGSALLGLGRDLVLPVLPKIGLARGKMLQTLAGELFRTGSRRLTDERP